MTITVTMKCPDAVDDAIIRAIEHIEDEEERQTEKERIQKVMQRWFEYGEYLTVDVDVEKKTCTVQTV